MNSLVVPIMVGVGLVGVLGFLGYSVWSYNRQRNKTADAFDSERLQRVPMVKPTDYHVDENQTPLPGIEHPAIVPTGPVNEFGTPIPTVPGEDLYIIDEDLTYPVEHPDEDPFLTDQALTNKEGVQQEILNSLTDLLARWKGRRTATPYGGKDTYRTAYEEVTSELADLLAKLEKHHG